MQESQSRILGSWSPAMPDTTCRWIGGKFPTCLQLQRREPPVKQTRAHKTTTIYLPARYAQSDCTASSSCMQVGQLDNFDLPDALQQGKKNNPSKLNYSCHGYAHTCLGRAPNVCIPRKLGG